MNNPIALFDSVEQLKKCSSADHMWQTLHTILSSYGVSSIFYGVGHSAKLAQVNGVVESVIYRDSHPQRYKEHYSNSDYINSDPSAEHCLQYTSPYMWVNTCGISEPISPEALEYEQVAKQLGMDIGVTLPLRFGSSGIGGIGLCTESFSSHDFATHWNIHQQAITAISYIFDELYRADFKQEIADLTLQEKEMLRCYFSNKTTSQIASKYHITEGTLHTHMSNIRKKLNVTNNASALIKAWVFQLISP